MRSTLRHARCASLADNDKFWDGTGRIDLEDFRYEALAIPIDVIPDFIPVLGYADDAIIVTAVLRSVVRRAGLEALHRHWPGTDDGLAAVTRLCGLSRQPNPSDAG